MFARLDRHKVVILEGARAVGKTTLVRKIAADRGGSYLDLSEQPIRAAIEANPDAVLTGLARPVVIDEAQLVDSLPLDIKRIVDADSSTGQFLLTGSSRLSRGALGGSDPLAGRATRLTMHPLTVGERLGSPHNMVEQWLSESPIAKTGAQIEHESLLRHITQGGLPGQVTAQPTSTSAEDWWQFAAETMPTYLDSALSLLYGKYDADRKRLTQAIRYLAANPAQVLNIARMANELTISRDTARRYVELLTDSLLLHLLPSVRPTAHKTLTAHPKIAIFDTAFAAWAAGVNPTRLIFDARVWGGLFENHIALEIAAQTSWTGPGITLGH